MSDFFSNLDYEVKNTRVIKPWNHLELDEFPDSMPEKVKESWKEMWLEVLYPNPKIRNSFLENTHKRVSVKVRGQRQKENMWRPDVSKAVKWFTDQIIKDWGIGEDTSVPYDYKAKEFLRNKFEQDSFLYDTFSEAYGELMDVASKEEGDDDENFTEPSTSSQKSGSQKEEKKTSKTPEKD